MFPLGHAMLPAGLLYALQQRGHLAGWDLRLVMLGGLLPDLVDKPLAYALGTIHHGHWLGHTLLAGLALLALGALAKALLPLGMGVLSHALLDRLPLTEPRTWLWPALGPMPTGGFGDPLAALLTPWALGGELLGAAVLLLMVHREGWLQPWRLRAFAATGQLLPRRPPQG